LTRERASAADEPDSKAGSCAVPGEHSDETGSPSSGAADSVVDADELKLRYNLGDQAHGDDLAEVQ